MTILLELLQLGLFLGVVWLTYLQNKEIVTHRQAIDATWKRGDNLYVRQDELHKNQLDIHGVLGSQQEVNTALQEGLKKNIDHTNTLHSVVERVVESQRVEEPECPPQD